MFSFAPTLAFKDLSAGCVVALGCFDGVHLGHRRLLACAKEQANRLNLPLAVYSPESKKGQASLSTAEEKEALLKKLGADFVFFADFDAIKGLSPQEFVDNILIGQLNCRLAVCGYNFSFGKMASGKANTLTELMVANQRQVIVQPSVSENGAPVSSTRIRALLSEGKTKEATDLLCRPYSVTGTVGHGRAIGRTLGFPTLNLPFPDGKLVPKAGVYYSHVYIDGHCYAAVTNIGVRPTFADSTPVPTLEAHLLHYAANLYEKEIEVAILQFLRPEKAFADIESLKATVMGDIEYARGLAAQDPFILNQRS